jgi:hypothetical protein
MARATRITKIKFHSINRDVKDAITSAKYNAFNIAKKHGVSDETVRSVRRAKTWPAFVTAKQLKVALVARGKKAIFDKIENAPTEKLAKGLKKLQNNPVEYITTKQFTDAIDSLNGKIKQDRIRGDIYRKEIDDLKGNQRMNTRILNRIQQLKPRWFRES